MGFSEAVLWWQQWQLRILVLSSLFLQCFLLLCSLLRKLCIPDWVRFFIWLAYLGSDAIALYALATLFNSPRGIYLGMKLLWAPILLMHIGGQDSITAYNIEDNELWKRHVLTAVSQITVAVYVFWRSWYQSERFLVAAFLLYIPGILKCILKPWDLKRVSINSLVDSSGSEETDGINSLEDFIQHANSYFRTSLGASVNAEGNNNEVELKKPYDLFVDLTPPYSHRLRSLKHLIRNAYGARCLVQADLSATFDRLYTKESVLQLQPKLQLNFSNLCITLLLEFINILRLVAGFCVFGAVLKVPISQGRDINTDVRITYILLYGTVFLEYCVPMAWFVIRTVIRRRSHYQQRWPDQVAQYNLLWYLARNKKCMTKKLRKLATLMVCKDYLDQVWCMTSCKSSSDITDLVHEYLAEGWTGRQRSITNITTYRAFNDNRGQWTLDREDCRRQLDWSIQRPFDESVVLWHLATDFCFHLAAPSPDCHQAASRCREISNYMAYLLFVKPEMLMTGARRSLFRAAYGQLKKTLKIIPQRDQAAAAEPPRHNTPREESQFARKVAQNIHHARGREDISIVQDAWRLAEDLKQLCTEQRDGRMWKVIRGVWLEMLCFSAGRCRGYLHAKSLGQGGEYLTYIWLLMSYMGMETLAERMQRTNLQVEATNDGGGANGTIAAIPAVPAAVGHGNGTTEAAPVMARAGNADDEATAAASPVMASGGGADGTTEVSPATSNGDENV